MYQMWTKRGRAPLVRSTRRYDIEAPRAVAPYGTEVGSARKAYSEFRDTAGVDATRYGDWEYSGRCTDFS